VGFEPANTASQRPKTVHASDRSAILTGAGRITSIEKSNDLFGNRTRDLPDYSIVPGPITLSRAFDTVSLMTYNIGDEECGHINDIVLRYDIVETKDRQVNTNFYSVDLYLIIAQFESQ
jgi:hypothetical protein